MKLIHCADIHLNSSLSTHLDGDKQKQRRTEILHTFLRMVDYAAEQSVDGILIAGDLFDTKKVDRATGNAVLSAITGHPETCFSICVEITMQMGSCSRWMKSRIT